MAESCLSKQCRGCKELMHPKDRHPFCLLCLTPSHQTSECIYCKEFGYAIFACRVSILGQSADTGVWPEDWIDRLLQVESKSWGIRLESPQSDQESESLKVVDPNRQVQTGTKLNILPVKLLSVDYGSYGHSK